MTVHSFAPTTRRTSVARSLAAKAKAKSDTKAAQDWVARIQDLVPNTEMVPVLASAAVMVVCLAQIF